MSPESRFYSFRVFSSRLRWEGGKGGRSTVLIQLGTEEVHFTGTASSARFSTVLDVAMEGVLDGPRVQAKGVGGLSCRHWKCRGDRGDFDPGAFARHAHRSNPIQAMDRFRGLLP